MTDQEVIGNMRGDTPTENNTQSIVDNLRAEVVANEEPIATPEPEVAKEPAFIEIAEDPFRTVGRHPFYPKYEDPSEEEMLETQVYMALQKGEALSPEEFNVYVGLLYSKDKPFSEPSTQKPDVREQLVERWLNLMAAFPEEMRNMSTPERWNTLNSLLGEQRQTYNHFVLYVLAHRISELEEYGELPKHVESLQSTFNLIQKPKANEGNTQSI